MVNKQLNIGIIGLGTVGSGVVETLEKKNNYFKRKYNLEINILGIAAKSKNLKAKRWVIFNGEIEASNIPPHWHAWLHKSIDNPPLGYSHKYKWQKNHKPNMTGTSDAYFPSSHPLSKNYDPEKKEEEYKSWTPN